MDAQDTVAETESVKIADLRVPKDVIALLAEGKRELFGKVLVMPSVKLKELRDVIAGTFEERMEGKPFYLLTTVSWLLAKKFYICILWVFLCVP